jgi:hypothetical protein
VAVEELGEPLAMRELLARPDVDPELSGRAHDVTVGLEERLRAACEPERHDKCR